MEERKSFGNGLDFEADTRVCRKRHHFFLRTYQTIKLPLNDFLCQFRRASNLTFGHPEFFLGVQNKLEYLAQSFLFWGWRGGYVLTLCERILVQDILLGKRMLSAHVDTIIAPVNRLPTVFLGFWNLTDDTFYKHAVIGPVHFFDILRSPQMTWSSGIVEVRNGGERVVVGKEVLRVSTELGSPLYMLAEFRWVILHFNHFHWRVMKHGGTNIVPVRES